MRTALQGRESRLGRSAGLVNVLGIQIAVGTCACVLGIYGIGHAWDGMYSDLCVEPCVCVHAAASPSVRTLGTVRVWSRAYAAQGTQAPVRNTALTRPCFL